MKQQGFSLVELITVLVIVGVLAAVATTRMTPQDSLALQTGRDQLISALFVAQQKAMAQSEAVAVITEANTIDIRMDGNGDGAFTIDESIAYAGVRYPLQLNPATHISSSTMIFDGLGHTQPGSFNLTLKENAIAVQVSGTGYAY